ncbi:MAG: calcium/sodium antiporter [Candidatus Buchananbacteria bacterium]
MLVQILLLILGFFFLYKGAGLLVDGSSSLAKKLKISAGIIGLTIVAFGTSTPELFINLISNFYNLPDIGTGNIVGANIAIILLATGLSTLIYPVAIKREIIRKELPLPIFATLILILLANNFFLGGLTVLGRIDGIILLLLFFVFLYYSIGRAKHIKPPDILEERWSTCTMHIIIGIAGLIIGGVLVILSSTQIASYFGLAGSVMGLSVIAFGTMLPELFASAIAASKKNAELAIGNIVGSILFNILFVLGISSIIKPLPFNFNPELIISLIAILLVYYFTFNRQDNKKIKRWEGALLLLVYIFYFGFVIFGI